jgi:hypothetical protein
MAPGRPNPPRRGGTHLTVDAPVSIRVRTKSGVGLSSRRSRDGRQTKFSGGTAGQHPSDSRCCGRVSARTRSFFLPSLPPSIAPSSPSTAVTSRGAGAQVGPSSNMCSFGSVSRAAGYGLRRPSVFRRQVRAHRKPLAASRLRRNQRARLPPVSACNQVLRARSCVRLRPCRGHGPLPSCAVGGGFSPGSSIQGADPPAA